jgi:hypothetical protein
MELASLEATPGHRSTGGRSGFARWKREVEGGLGGLGVGISFRHSDSTNGRAPSRYDAESEPLSTKSSAFTISSKPSSKKSRGQGKKKTGGRHASDSSWSPSFAVELPVRPSSSADSQKDKDSDHFHAEGHHQSISSGLTSLSYMSTPSPANNVLSLAPPSYTASSPNRTTNGSPPHSIPRSVSHSTPSSGNHSRSGSEGLLLNYGALNVTTPTEGPGRDYEPFVSNASPPNATLYPPHSFADDRGSTQYSSDDTKSVLGPSAARQALRGLSPRTELVRPRTRSAGQRGEQAPLPLPPNVQTNIQQRIMESPRQWEEEQNAASELQAISELNASKGVSKPDAPDNLLSVRSTSPFRIDFSGPVPPPPKHKRASTRASASFVRFEDDPEEVKLVEVEKGKKRADEEQASEENPPKKRSLFRLTPPSKPRPPNTTTSSRHQRRESTSFLDFSSSSDASYRTQSVVTSSEFSERDRHWASLPHNQPKSRWSNTLTQSTDLSRSGTRATNFSRTTRTTDLSRSDSSGVSIFPTSPASAPRSVFSGGFPYPVSLPPSPHHPEGHKRTPSPPLPWQSPVHTRDTSAAQTSVHPFEDVASPTDSVPMSVSDIKFRHSTSTGVESHSGSHSSVLPPHPPLPGREGDDSDVGTPGVSTPHYIVQRVLGQTPIASAIALGFNTTGPPSDSPVTLTQRNDNPTTTRTPPW